MFCLIDIHYMVPYRAPKNVLSCIIARISGYVYKVLGINSAILLHLYGYDAKSKILIIFLIYSMVYATHTNVHHGYPDLSDKQTLWLEAHHYVP